MITRLMTSGTLVLNAAAEWLRNIDAIHRLNQTMICDFIVSNTGCCFMKHSVVFIVTQGVAL